MPHTSINPIAGAHDTRMAIIFVDYQNLYTRLRERLGAGASPDDHIIEALDELKQYLLDADGTRTAQALAYADFNALGGDSQLQRGLYAQSIEPRFVPATLQDHASEVQLCVEAVDFMHRRPEVRTFAVVTGNRAYLPLVQTLKRYGRHVFVAGLDTPPAAERLQYAEGNVFLDLRKLVGEAADRPSGEQQGGRSAAGRTDHTPSSQQRDGRSPAQKPAQKKPTQKQFRALTNPTAFRALEIAEEFFGQYEEVYLTPLLRKLSDILGEAYDPKSLISELEACGVVRLEKREGYPYDYTVLIMHYEHDAVQKVTQQLHRKSTSYGPPLSETEAEARSSYLDDYASMEQRVSATYAETEEENETTPREQGTSGKEPPFEEETYPQQ